MAESRGMSIVRSNDGSIMFRATLFDAANAKIIAGTTEIRIWHIVPTSGDLEAYDWNDNTFKTTALTDDEATMTYQSVDNHTYDTGVWTYRHTTLTDFDVGDKYMAEVSHASLPRPIFMEFQYGDLDGDHGRQFLVRGPELAPAVGAASITLAAAAPATLDYYNGALIEIVDGTGVGQVRTIRAYSAGRVCSVDPWVTALGADSRYVIHPQNHETFIINSGMALGGVMGPPSTVDLALTADGATDNIYVGMVIVITGGTGAGQARAISAYDAAPNRRATVWKQWSVAPDATSTYTIIPIAADNIAAAVWDEDYTLHGIPSTFGFATRYQLTRNPELCVVAGTDATHIQLNAAASVTANIYNGCVVSIVYGTGVGQSRVIQAYTGATQIATVRAWTTVPDITSYYVIVHKDNITEVDNIWDEDVVAAHGTADTAGLLLRALGAEISQRTWNNTLNDLLGVPDTAATDTLAGQVWEEALALHNTAGSMGEVMNDIAAAGYPSDASIADAVWDEDIVVAHHTADTAGLMAFCLGYGLSTRVLGYTDLMDILAVPDLALATLPDAVWDEDVTTHVVALSAGAALDALGTAIDGRAFNANLNALLGVVDVATADIAWTIWDELIDLVAHATPNSAAQRLSAIDYLTEPTGNGDLTENLLQTKKIDKAACLSPATAGSVADKLDVLTAMISTIDRDIVCAVNIESLSLRIEVAAEQYGVLVVGYYDQCVAQIFDEAGAIIANIGAGDFGAANVRGFFQYTWTPHTLTAGKTYQIEITLTDTGTMTTYQNTKIFKVVNV